MFLNECLSKTHDGGTPTNCLDSAAAAAAEPRKKKPGGHIVSKAGMEEHLKTTVTFTE